MDYLVPIFCFLLLALLIFFIGYPLVGAAAAPFRLREGEHQRLVERREQLLAAIKEIEFDQAMGKFPDGEYQPLRRQLEAEAMGVLHQLDQFKSQTGRGKTIEARIEKDILALRQHVRSHCPSCGANRRPTDRFCAGCGTRFEEAGTA